MPELYCTLDGKTPAQRRASLPSACAAYRRRFGVDPPSCRAFRSGRTVYVAFPVTYPQRFSVPRWT